MDHTTSSHEERWYLTQKARIQNARPNATLIWTEGDNRIDVPAGYYVFWYDQFATGHTERVHQYMGIGDASTQVNIENWITQYGRRK
jgi:hypothetical protein